MSSSCLGLALVCFSSLFIPVSPQSAEDASRVAAVSYRHSSVEWSPIVPADNLILTVSGPGGLYLKQEHPGPRFDAVDEQGRARPDGRYNWELIVQFAGQPSRVLSGWFEIHGGKIISQEAPPEKVSASVDPGAPENSAFVDAEGRLGIGTSVPGTQLHIKGSDASLGIENTQAGGHEYRLRSLESGDGSLGLFDQTTGNARWLVDSEGRLGINTTRPTSTLTVDGYIESTKGFLVNGRPVGGSGIGFFGGSQPLSTESGSNNFFGTGAGASITIGDNNSFFGADAGRSTTFGEDNCFFGSNAGYSNTGGNANYFFGTRAGYSNTAGSHNAFFGGWAGYDNTTGDDNCFFGGSAGMHSSTGTKNCFFGHTAGFWSTGNDNSFFGDESGFSNTTGFMDSFFGSSAGYSNTTGYGNAFFGGGSGHANTTGDYNSFFGRSAGFSNTTGNYNAFFGGQAGYHNTVEHTNTFVGMASDLDPGPDPAGSPIHNATAIGYRAYVSRSNSLVLGGVSGFNSVVAETFVGIGTPSPDRQLVVEGTQALGKFRRFNATGPDFGPAFLFERARGLSSIPADIHAGDYLGKVQFRGRVAGNFPEYGAITFIASDTNQNGRFSFVDRDMLTERMVILNTGNVGIGTNAPTEQLDVNGNLRVRGGIVYGAPAVPVPDYVFAPDFQLMPMSELARYVAREKHLPNIPAAAEISNNGVNLGEFQMKLLEKIEELTLYTIEQAETIHRQTSEIDRQKQRIDRHDEETAALRARIQALEQLVKQLATRR